MALCIILCIFVFLCDILLPSGVINDDDNEFAAVGTVLCGGSRYRALSFIPEVGYIYCLWPQQFKTIIKTDMFVYFMNP